MNLSWYAVRTNIRCEERAKLGLEAVGLRVYLPTESELRGRGKWKLIIDKPFLPRHLFVGTYGNELLVPRRESFEAELANYRTAGPIFLPADMEAVTPLEAVRRTDGVESILSTGRTGMPQTVREDDLEVIRIAESELEAKFQAKLNHDRRREELAERGKLPDDTRQVVEKLLTAPKEERVGVVLELIGRGARARMPLADLQKMVY